ncbi:SRPBCC family protein [Paenibacillus dokdonensis]|uniref:SRPBCC family protein n=1 Tax=Paenibacillus dokdonensis TaxID=2567944 RepID=UPI001FE597A3|nr:SRPBCC family protein [Paenibacillus dokdonensis]
MMPTIRKEIMIVASPDQVWDAVSDIGAVHYRLVPGYTENTLIDGYERILFLAGGGITREYIVSIDEEERRMAYSVVEGRMPLLNHHASFQVSPHDDNSTKLIRITDFLPAHLAPEIQARINRGAEVMKETIEAEAKRRRSMSIMIVAATRESNSRTLTNHLSCYEDENPDLSGFFILIRII